MLKQPPNNKVIQPGNVKARPVCPECGSGKWEKCKGPYTDRMRCRDCEHRWVITKGG